jgi:hypothetical protein
MTSRKVEAVSAFESGDIARSITAHLLPPEIVAHEEPTLAQGYV